MKCISLNQPLASLVAVGATSIVTRAWDTGFRGPLGIHAATRWDGLMIGLAADDELFAAPLRAAGLTEIPLGCVVATCRLAHVIRIYRAAPMRYAPSGVTLPPPEPECWYGDYAPGRYAWILEDVRPLATPVPFAAGRRFFDVPDALLGLAPTPGLFTV